MKQHTIRIALITIKDTFSNPWALKHLVPGVIPESDLPGLLSALAFETLGPWNADTKIFLKTVGQTLSTLSEEKRAWSYLRVGLGNMHEQIWFPQVKNHNGNC
uniref:Uncharacterized protein n=1 Tax=Cacopsylla melanoneura TaxID=428564 RepID=A0A8D8SXI9_9HEMI